MGEGRNAHMVVILSVLTAIFLVSTVTLTMNVSKLSAIKDKEISKRLDAEESSGKCDSERKAFKEKYDRFSRDIEVALAAADSAKKSLAQEQMVNASLKEELNKVNSLKVTLEENLKQALAEKATLSKTKK